MVETTDGKTPLQPKSQAYYDMLYPAILDNPEALAAIAYSLKTRDLKGYSGLHRAPTTAAKKAMMAQAADDVEKWMMEHRDDEPLCRHVVTVDEILEHMPNDVARMKGARTRIPEVLRDHFNGESLGQVRLAGRSGKKPSLWAINKTKPNVSIRETMKDPAIAYLYLNERWEATPADKAAMAQGLKAAQAEFSEPWDPH